MNNIPDNSAAQPQQMSADPNATRYFPQQGTYDPAPGVGQPAPTPSAGQQASYNAQNAYPPAANGSQPYQITNQGGYSRPYDRDRTVLALLFIGGGALFLLAQLPFFTGFDIGGLILLLIGGIFMYAYANTRPGYRIGFLIPGSILLGLGAGELLSNLPFMQLWDGGSITGLTLGLGFCLIWFLERRHWWALIPGGILVLTAFSTLSIIGRLWPLALVAIGVYLLYDQSRRRN